MQQKYPKILYLSSWERYNVNINGRQLKIIYEGIKMKQERDILNVVIKGLMRSDYGKLGFSVAEKNGNFFSAADIALGNADCINRY